RECASFVEGSPVVAASATISKPVAPTVPPGIDINSLGARRNIVRPLSRATVRPPFLLRFESKALHEGASFVEGRPLPSSQPIVPTVPPGIGINRLGSPGNIIGSFARAAVRPPFHVRLEAQAARECASFLEGAPTMGTIA